MADTPRRKRKLPPQVEQPIQVKSHPYINDPIYNNNSCPICHSTAVQTSMNQETDDYDEIMSWGGDTVRIIPRSYKVSITNLCHNCNYEWEEANNGQYSYSQGGYIK